MKRIIVGILLSTTLFGQNFVTNFFKYSTAYAGFNLSSPKWEDDRYKLQVINPETGLEDYLDGQVTVKKDDRTLDPDFDVSVGLRKIGRFEYEPKRGVKNAGVGGDWYTGDEHSFNEAATIGKVRGWEYLLKYSTNRRWDEKFVSQEYFLRYLGDWFIAKIKYTDFEMEDITYAQSDIRLRKEFSSETASLNFSIGVGTRNHPAYGFAPTVIDSTWYSGEWWDFAEDEFGVDDKGYSGDIDGDELGDEAGGIGIYDNATGEYVGYVGLDWRWFDRDGNLMAATDREFYQYHFPDLLENWFDKKTKALGNQREVSLSLGVDYYKYTEEAWYHLWASVFPYHYGLNKYSYHNAVNWQEHEAAGKPPEDFMFMDSMWHSWLDFDLGMIIGFKLKDNLGFYSEGKYLNYWNRPAYELKVGVNYQFLGL